MAHVIEVNANTWRIEDGGVRFFLLAGTEKAILIDTGMNAPDARDIAESLTTLPVYLINTHADPDHISGNGKFSEMYMHEDEADNYSAHGGQGSIIPVQDGEVIELGDRPLKIIALPGHTPGSICILDINARVLYSGDSVQNSNIFMFGSHRNLSKYIESMKMLSKREADYDTIYPSHGTLPLKPDVIPELLAAANSIAAGTATGKQVEVFGMPVMLYSFDCAGFLCDMK